MCIRDSAGTVQFFDRAWGATHDGEPCPPARYAGWSVVLTGSASEPTNFVDATGVVYRRRKDAARAMGILAGPLSESACQWSKYARTPFGDQRALLLESGTPSPPAVVSAAAARAGIRREALPAPRDEDDVPEEFLCPISMEVMTDPVIAADGHTYERRAIEAWFGRAHTSPTTNAPLPHLNLIPAHTIKSLIQRHLEQ